MPRAKYLLALLLAASFIFIFTVIITFKFGFLTKSDFDSTLDEQAALKNVGGDGGGGGEDVIGDIQQDVDKRDVKNNMEKDLAHNYLKNFFQGGGDSSDLNGDGVDPNNNIRNVDGADDGDGEQFDYLLGIVGSGFLHAFIASLSVIIVSELGDKTFFIAAIMAMRHPRIVIFTGAALALIVMTILSVFLGFAITVIPRTFTYYVSSVLFAVFGVRLLREGWYMSPDEGKEEYEEVQAELNKKDDELRKQQESTYVADPETGVIRGGPQRRTKLMRFFSPIFLQAFTLTFLAEWGDRSQITTIVLAARENVYGVALGGFLGHSLCTALAVIGGRIVAQRISVRTVTMIGGVVFMLFALSAFVIGP